MMLLKAIYERFCSWIKVCTKTDLMIALHKLIAFCLLVMYTIDANTIHMIAIYIKKAQIVYI